MPGFCTREQRPFVIDLESAFSRHHRRLSSSVYVSKGKAGKSGTKRLNGIIHVGHGNITPSGSPALPSERKHAWPLSDTEDSNRRKIDEELARRFWAVNTSQNQSKSSAKNHTVASEELSKKQQKQMTYKKDVVVMRRQPSYEAIDRVRPTSFDESSEASTNMTHSTKVKAVVRSASRETHESGLTTKTGTQLSSSGSTLQVFENLHSGKLSNFMCDLYAHDQLTDIKVHVGSYGFNAHKVVLACFSPYFANILLNSDKLDEYVLAKNITPTGFKKVLDYMYTKELTIEVENLAEILQAADILQIKDLQEQCYAILKTAKPRALIDILETSHKQGVRYICENIILSKLSHTFYEVQKMDELLQLCAQCFSLLLSRDDLVIESEYVVAQTAVKWIRYSSEERLKIMEDVFAFVRFENMTSNQLLQLGQEANFLMDNKCIAEAILRIHWSRRSMELGMVDSFSMHPPQPRNYKAKKDVKAEDVNKDGNGKSEKVSANNNSKSLRQSSVYVSNMLKDHITNWHPQTSVIGSDESSCGKKNSENQPLDPLKLLVVPKDIFTNIACNVGALISHFLSVDTEVRNQRIVKTGDSAYLIGGTLGPVTGDAILQPTNKVIKINLITSEVCEWFPMWEPRYLHSVALVRDVIYAIGGVTLGGHCLRNIESLEYSHTKYGWKRECEMPSSRCGSAVAVIHEKMYIAGGSQNPKQLGHIMDSVLEYNTKTKQWAEIQSLRYPRFGANMVSDNGRLYIIGGITSEKDQKNVITADIDIWDGQKWIKRARLQKARFNCSVIVQSSRIIILGGYSDTKSIEDTISESEVFNINRKMWENSPSFDESNNHNLHVLL